VHHPATIRQPATNSASDTDEACPDDGRSADEGVPLARFRGNEKRRAEVRRFATAGYDVTAWSGY